MPLTPAQQEAVAARGNVLVVAGAGTGKTKTLVERCLSCLLEEKPAGSLDEILMVTFTEAAAAEMRQRIRSRLEKELERDGTNPHLREQLALFDSAAIGTLHSFCLQLVRQHFYELELDPEVAVLAPEEAQVLSGETLDKLLEACYGGAGPAAEGVRRLIQAQGGGSADLIRSLVLRLHHYTQTQPDPAAWLDRQLTMFASPEPRQWRLWLAEALDQWRERWLPLLETKAAGNDLARKCLAALNTLPGGSATDQQPPPAEAGQNHTRGAADKSSRLAPTAAVFDAVRAAFEDCPRAKKTLWAHPFKGLQQEAEFLGSLIAAPGQADPLAEDWGWVRGEMTTLLNLAKEFTRQFSEAKQELGTVDFHDLEQCALRLLWERDGTRPTAIADEWRDKLRFIFVDEYQDINAAQDKIIEGLSRDGTHVNRFLVGDVKQSIYRFRLADPRIFQGYVEAWGSEPAALSRGALETNQSSPPGPIAGRACARAIPLVDNFRSREGILDFTNSLFGMLMTRQLGGVAYDKSAQLRFGAPGEREAQRGGRGPCVELHLRVKARAGQRELDEEPSAQLTAAMDLQESAKEARLLALRLHELKRRQHPVWDDSANSFRPVNWSDIAILLRSPAGKAESYAKEFSRLNVPLLVARGGFYDSLEISDLRSLLQMLDNPLQDIPVLAVLRSPLVGLTLEELATIRLGAARAPFWTALILSAGSGGRRAESAGEDQGSEAKVQSHDPASRSPHPATLALSADARLKVSTFLTRFARWRRLSRQSSLSRCLDRVLSETHYADWLLTQPRGAQRHANVQRLLGLARQFDRFQRQGLFRFLRFVEAQERAETEPEISAVPEENSVRLMSIHQSKGLEFPVVVVADLGKAFNLQDLQAQVILDEVYGLGPHIKPPHTGRRYPSLPHWLAGRRQKLELLGEELRLLYVAATRARDLLLLSGAASPSLLDRVQQAAGAAAPAPAPPDGTSDTAALAELASARSCLDWIGLWLAQQPGSPKPGDKRGETPFLNWILHEDSELVLAPPQPIDPCSESATLADPQAWQTIRQRLAWQYPFALATRLPAKTSVSLLRGAASAPGADDETAPLSLVQNRTAVVPSPSPLPAPQAHPPPGLGQAEYRTADSPAFLAGTAHHKFLQFVSLERVESLNAVRQEAERLKGEQIFSGEELALLDLGAMAAFWQSELGGKVRAQARFVQRELAFTARFSPQELAMLAPGSIEGGLEAEFMVVQGVADLAVVLPGEIWLLDFKTDRLEDAELAEKVASYEPQLRLYAHALAKIYRRPVSECWLCFLIARTNARIRPVELSSKPE